MRFVLDDRPTGFGIEAQVVVSRYPREKVLASGWRLDEEYLKERQGPATPVTAAEMGKWASPRAEAT
jgi:hypothetical protein